MVSFAHGFEFHHEHRVSTAGGGIPKTQQLRSEVNQRLVLPSTVAAKQHHGGSYRTMCRCFLQCQFPSGMGHVALPLQAPPSRSASLTMAKTAAPRSYRGWPGMTRLACHSRDVPQVLPQTTSRILPPLSFYVRKSMQSFVIASRTRADCKASS